MTRFTTSSLTISMRAAVTSALGLALLGAMAAPAAAEEAGVISKYRGSYPTYSICNDFGQREQDRHGADSFGCYRQGNNTYDLYLMWYT